MGPKGMKYQEIKKSNCIWSRKLIKKAFSQFLEGPHIVKICGSICVDLDPSDLKTSKCLFLFIFDGSKRHEISRNKEICVWSRKLIKKAFSQFLEGPHIVKICGSICVDLDPSDLKMSNN